MPLDSARDAVIAVQARVIEALAGESHGAGRLLVGPGPESVAAGDQEQVGVLLQQRPDLLVSPGHGSVRPGSQLAATRAA